MKKYLFIKTVAVVIIALVYTSKVKSETRLVNVLHEDYFGFEAGAAGWYFWGTNDYWNVVTDKASAGTYSMCFSHSDLSDESTSVKAQVGSTGDEGSLFEVKAGTHSLTLKVYVEPGTTVNNFQLVLKDPWTVINFDISELVKGEWVTLTKEIILAEDVSTVWQLVVGGSENGGGTFYIDEMSIMQEVEIPDYIPENSSIKTIESVKIALNTGSYLMRLKVWKDATASTAGFYTSLQNAHTSLFWDISELSTGSWVTLEQNFNMCKPVDDAGIMIQIPNDPECGGGKGVFYIDEIEIVSQGAVNNNHVPVAVGGGDVLVKRKKTFALDGSLSYDLEGDNLTYQWVVPEGFFIDDATLANPTITAPDVFEETSYNVVLRVSDGSSTSNDDVIKVTVLLDTSIESNYQSLVKMYPNPSQGELTLSAAQEVQNVKILALDGTLIKTEDSFTNQMTFDLKGICSGIYLVKIKFKDGVFISKKLVIK